MIHFDLHCDTMTEAYSKNENLYKNNLCVDFERLSEFDKAVQIFANFTNDILTNDAVYERFIAVDNYFDKQLYDNSKIVELIKTKGQLNTKKIGIIKSIENIRIIDKDIEKVNMLYKKGYRLTTLTWNESNQFAGGKNDKLQGITPLGKDLIRQCDNIGFTIDVSHLNDKSFYDLLEISTKPIIASHSNSRAVMAHKRNLTDEQIKLIIERNGLIGINYFTEFLSVGVPKLEDILNHINHILELGGEKVLALGSDFDGAEMPSFLTDISKVTNLKTGLYALGLNEQLICDIMYNNAYKFFYDNLKGA